MKKSVSERDFSSEFTFKASRSSGAGGQNVNKVNTRVELRFIIADSTQLTEEEKLILLEKLKKRINREGELIIVSQSERTQLRNKEKTIERFYSLLEKTLIPVKKRKSTKPSKSAIEKRLNEKKLLSEKKILRKKKIE